MHCLLQCVRAYLVCSKMKIMNLIPKLKFEFAVNRIIYTQLYCLVILYVFNAEYCLSFTFFLFFKYNRFDAAFGA